MQELIERCAAIQKAKGFNPIQHATQIAMVATEVAEALEELHIPMDTDDVTRRFIDTLKIECFKLEQHRANLKVGYRHFDTSEVINRDAFLRELSDIVIRVFSYVGGNDMTKEFVVTLHEVVTEGENRAYLHNKRF